MSKLTYFPLLNSLRMTPLGNALPEKYNFFQMDAASYCQQLRSNQAKVPYVQKIQYSNLQALTFYTTAFAESVSVKILNQAGAVVDTLISSLGMSIPYTYVTAEGLEVVTDTHFYKWFFAENDYAEGFYWVQVEVAYDGGGSETFRSEPLWVRKKHKNTALLEYTNSTDKGDVLFSLFNVVFSLLVESDYMTLETASKDVVYTKQNQELRQLDSTPYRVWEFKVNGVPEYVLDKMQRIMSCDKFRIEGTRYLKEDGAKIDADRFGNYPLVYPKVKLREWDQNAAGAAFETEAPVYDQGETYPFAHTSYTFTDGITYFVRSARVFADVTEQNTEIADLNGPVSLANGLQGSFQIKDDRLVYNNAAGEHFYVLSYPKTMDDYIELTVEVASAAVPFRHAYKTPVGGSNIVKYGAGVFLENLGTGSNANVVFNYSTTGTKTVQLFTDNTMSELSLGFPGTTTITNITGKVSTELKHFQMGQQDFSGLAELDISFLFPCHNSLQSLVIPENKIVKIKAGWCQDLIPISPITWPVLTYIFVAGNNMDTDDISAFFEEHYSFNLFPTGGFMNLKQDPAAPPNATALGHISNMITFSAWGIQHD